MLLRTPGRDRKKEAIALTRAMRARPAGRHDQQLQIFLADRLTAPALVDTSHVRIVSGSLTDAGAIAASESARVVVLWTGRLERLTEYTRWVQAHFRLVHRFESPDRRRREVYVRD